MARFPFQADPILTALVVSYRNPQASYIADDFLPRTPVGGERFGWQRMPPEQSITVPETRVGRTGRPNVVEFEGTRETSETMDYGLDTPIPQTDIDEAAALRSRGLSTYDPLQNTTLTLTDLMMVDREVRVARIGQDPTNYAGSAVLPPAAMFDDYADSDPIKTIQGAISSYSFYEYNTMTMGFRVFTQLRSHPKIVNAVKGNYTGSGIVSQEELRQLFGMDKVLVGRSFVNTARRGQPVNRTRVWGNNLALTYVNPAANVENPTTFGMTAQFGSRIGGTMPDSDIGIRGGIKVRVGEQVRELVTAPDAGYLIQNCVHRGREMALKPLRTARKGAGKTGADALALAPLDPLGPLPAEEQALPIFATLGGAPVAVLPLDEYRRLVLAALDGVAPRRPAAPQPAGKAPRATVSTVERDPEVAAFLRELFGLHKTVAELRAACIERFGEARTPSLTRITIFRQRTR